MFEKAYNAPASAERVQYNFSRLCFWRASEELAEISRMFLGHPALDAAHGMCMGAYCEV